jgi:TolB-like protein/DNA-binding winged helix-turn-helix (wHTH) protein/Tfp pilus assembly protein PilF
MMSVYTVEGSMMIELGERDFRLGSWVVTPKLNSLTKNGKTVHLEPKVMQVLVCLAEAGDVVPKERLMSRVWAGTFVTDDVLTRSISELRKVFEDDPKNPQYIQTIPKGGYRLLVAVEEVNSGNGLNATVAESLRLEPARAAHAPKPKRAKLAAWLGIGLVASLVTIFLVRRSTSHTPGSAQRAMLAVLPFQNLNNDPSQSYFADGLTAEMISQLGRLPSDRLGVIAWDSMMRYKGVKKTDEEVGWELGANYILEGTVRREGEQVRITAELVKVGSRSHIWANSYDGDLSDVLAVQSRIAREIASEIQLRLTPEQQARLDNPAQVNGQGYDAYLQGKAMTELGTKMITEKVPKRLDEAIRLNPSYAPPYVTLAVYYRSQASFGFAPSRSSYAAARLALEKALQIDPGLASAHRELAWVAWRGDWDFASAAKEFQLALDLNPGEAVTHEELSLYLKSQGRYEEALREINRSLVLSPLEPISHANAGTLLGLMGRYDESMEEFREALKLDPKQQYVHERLGAVLIWQGKLDQAIEEFQKTAELANRMPEKLAWLGYANAVNGKRKEAFDLLGEIERNPRQQYVSPFHVAMLYAGLDDKENALAWLDKAYEEHDEWMVYLKIYPEFNSLHSDAHFQDIARRVGL